MRFNWSEKIGTYWDMKKKPRPKAKAKSHSKSPGRPPKGRQTMHQIALRLPVEMLDEIDKMIEGRLDQPEKSAVIRELLAEAITARKRRNR